MKIRNINTRGSVQTLKRSTKYSVQSNMAKLKFHPQPQIGTFIHNIKMYIAYSIINVFGLISLL